MKRLVILVAVLLVGGLAGVATAGMLAPTVEAASIPTSQRADVLSAATTRPPDSRRVALIAIRASDGTSWSSTSLLSRSSATKGASVAERGGLNLFRWKDPTSTTASGWRDGGRMLTVPWKGTPKATWKENASRLRREMRSGDPIYESYADEAGNLIPTKGFLNAERNLLGNRGWQYDPRTRSWGSGR